MYTGIYSIPLLVFWLLQCLESPVPVPQEPGWFSSVSSSEGVRSGFFEQALWCNDLAAVTHHPQNLIKSLEELLEEPGDLETLDSSARLRIATNLLSGLENFLRTLALAMPEAPFTYHSPKNTGKASSCPRSQPWAPFSTRSPQSLSLSPQSCP